MNPDPRPAPRIVNPKCLPLAAVEQMTVEGVYAVGVCPLCGQWRKLSRAHVVPKGLRGDDVPENLAWICGDGVMGCHGLLTHGNRVIGHPITAEQARARFVVYCQSRVPQLATYAAEKKGPFWLAGYYLDNVTSIDELVA